MNHYAVENLFGIEGLNIAWYGIIITFGMILGFMLALRRCKKTGVEPDHLYNLVLWLIPVCILCARAYYVLFEWEQYKDNLLSVFQINKGGLAIYGGILGGVAVVLIYCKVKKFSFWSLADIRYLIVPTIHYVSQAIYAGGIDKTSNDVNDKYHWFASEYGCSIAWENCESMYFYFTHNNYWTASDYIGMERMSTSRMSSSIPRIRRSRGPSFLEH